MAAPAASPSSRVTLRLAAVALMAILAGLPLSILPSLGALAALALVVGGAGAIAASVPLATAGGALALIEYALALVVAAPDPDPVTGTAVGVGLVLLLADRSHDALLLLLARGPAPDARISRQLGSP